MALLLKKLCESYEYLMHAVADPRVLEYPLMHSPIPVMIILGIFAQFVLKWGPQWMQDRKPMELKRVMIVYNILQVAANLYIFYELFVSRHDINWQCAAVDYSESPTAMRHLRICYIYFLLKIVDLLDTAFFVLRKKTTHLSFLHLYHHFGMVAAGWIGVKFVAGGHSYFIGFANSLVHAILYSYYLLTAYDNKYSKLVWLKKFITQTQLVQFVFLLWSFSKLLFIPDCSYPSALVFLFIPQNLFMILLFGDFYIRTYIIKPKTLKGNKQNCTKTK